jgi:hypothetical protein
MKTKSSVDSTTPTPKRKRKAANSRPGKLKSVNISPSGSKSCKGDVIVTLALVEYGYQIDVYNYTRATPSGSGVIHSMQCRDLAGSYDIAKIADAAGEAIMDAMRKLEHRLRCPTCDGDRHVIRGTGNPKKPARAVPCPTCVG